MWLLGFVKSHLEALLVLPLSEAFRLIRGEAYASCVQMGPGRFELKVVKGALKPNSTQTNNRRYYCICQTMPICDIHPHPCFHPHVTMKNCYLRKSSFYLSRSGENIMSLEERLGLAPPTQ